MRWRRDRRTADQPRHGGGAPPLEGRGARSVGAAEEAPGHADPRRTALGSADVRLAPPPMIAALYVDTARGPYARMRGVECWGYATRDGRQLDALAPTRDARDYAGPWPVVAHPPCGPWGRFRRRYLGGEGDRECALVAVEQVRRYGRTRASGVLAPVACPDRSLHAGRWARQVRRVHGGDQPVRLGPSGDEAHLALRGRVRSSADAGTSGSDSRDGSTASERERPTGALEVEATHHAARARELAREGGSVRGAP